MPSYSAADLTSGLSSTSWLLSQPVDFQLQHIPVPYELSSLTQPQPPFSTPARFGDPLEVRGWKDRRPSWVLAVPQVTELTHTSTFKCFKPPVTLNEDELRRPREYIGLFPSPVVPGSSTVSLFLPGSGDSAFEGSDTLPSRDDGTVPSSGSYPSQLGKRDNDPGAGLPAGSSLAFQALYANDAVKQAFVSLNQPSVVLDSGSDDDDEDDDWEDRMDPVTFARYSAASSPHLAKIVQEHDQKVRLRLDQEITNWAQEVTFEGDAL